ncbi:MAG: hypothetical protein E6G51_03980 [Actinobacteria bacterium]|nr:MAG: hypothetical protein E6G51_03980 [Actinomycetota bacterium]
MGVAKTDRFEKRVEELDSDLSRLDEAIRFAEHQLSEFPTAGIPTSIPGLYSFPIRLPTRTGQVRLSIFYLYDGKDVRFMDLRPAEP